MTIGLRPLAVLDVAVAEPMAVGATPAGEIRLVPITGGSVSGDEIHGHVLAGGADWQEVRGEGILEISARYLLETDDGEVVEVRSDGLRHTTPEDAERLLRSEDVDSASYYFRTAVRLRTAAPRLMRLNCILAVAEGERRRGRVHLTLFEIT